MLKGGGHRDLPEQGELGAVGRNDHLGPGQAAPDQPGRGHHQPAGGDQGAVHTQQPDEAGTTTEPNPMAAMLRPSRTPKTRLRTWLGALC
jgi:hypothetical protein